MTFVEALRQSKERAAGADVGPAFAADGGWYRWKLGWVYKLTADELLETGYEFTDEQPLP